MEFEFLRHVWLLVACRPPLRQYLLDGDFFVGAALSTTLTKLALRYVDITEDAKKQNVSWGRGLNASEMLARHTSCEANLGSFLCQKQSMLKSGVNCVLFISGIPSWGHADHGHYYSPRQIWTPYQGSATAAHLFEAWLLSQHHCFKDSGVASNVDTVWDVSARLSKSFLAYLEWSQFVVFFMHCCLLSAANHWWWCGPHCHLCPCSGWEELPDVGDLPQKVPRVTVGHAGGKDRRRERIPKGEETVGSYWSVPCIDGADHSSFFHFAAE